MKNKVIKKAQYADHNMTVIEIIQTMFNNNCNVSVMDVKDAGGLCVTISTTIDKVKSNGETIYERQDTVIDDNFKTSKKKDREMIDKAVEAFLNYKLSSNAKDFTTQSAFEYLYNIGYRKVYDGDKTVFIPQDCYSYEKLGERLILEQEAARQNFYDKIMTTLSSMLTKADKYSHTGILECKDAIEKIFNKYPSYKKAQQELGIDTDEQDEDNEDEEYEDD